ncbi:hypothetical protein [Sphingomonas sp. 1P08PE]|uniref:hypothetical protein n=1 Tax=Sphingomonas sp. 1P08PE TaxID=554122 RepID=UPI0039A21F0E
MTAVAVVIGGGVVASPAPEPVQPPIIKKPFQLGINLVSGVYWSGEQLFNNLATSDEWPAEFKPDSLGNITIPAGKTARRLLHPPVEVLNHTAKVQVVCTWRGGAKGFVDGMHRASKPWTMVPGRLTFEWNGLAPDAGINTWIDFRGGNVADLQCLDTKADPKQIFSAEFRQSIKPFSVLRNLDISPANGNQPTDQIVWDTRTRAGSIDQLRNGHMSYELFVDLNNGNRSSPWFTLPYNASASYHRSLAQMVHDRLDPSLPVYVEDGNEVWNPTFAANAQARKVGEEQKLNENVWIAGHLAYANHVKATMAIWSDVFKDRPGQLVRIYGAWSASPWHTELAFNEGKVGGHVDAVAIAPYFGHDLGEQLKTVTNRRERIVAMNAAVDKAIAEMKAQKAVTERFKVRLVAYEAGQHIVGGDAMAELNRDPAMYEAYKRYIAAWRDNVGDVMVLYNATGRMGPYGAWGIREFAGQPLSQTPKRRAAIEMAPAR